MITALCGQAGGITKSGKPCRIRVSDSGRLCMAHDPQHRKNGLLAEDGDHNVTQTITDGIIKGIGDGPDPGHHEPAEHNPYTLPTTQNGRREKRRRRRRDTSTRPRQTHHRRIQR